MGDRPGVVRQPKTAVFHCPGGHALGQVVQWGTGRQQLLLYREAVEIETHRQDDDQAGGEKGASPQTGERAASVHGQAEVDVIAVVDGAMMDVRCSICGQVRTWAPSPETMRRMIRKYLERPREEPQGLFDKYRIEKADGSPVNPQAVYFTLRLDTDRHARAAIRVYAESVRGENPVLARDLVEILDVRLKNLD